MDDEELKALALYLLDRRENDRPADACKAADLPPLRGPEDAYAVHGHMMGIKSTLGDPVGWKCGACGRPAWESFGLAEPFRAPLFRARLVGSGSVVSRASQRRLKLIEAEIGFVMGKPLPPRATPYTRQEVWDAVSHVVPSLEIVGSRWAGSAWQAASGIHKIADGGLNDFCILGTPIPTGNGGGIVRVMDALGVAISVNGIEVAVGTGDNVLGHPVESLRWLAHALHRGRTSTHAHVWGGGAEIGLLAGDFVMTGAAALVKADSLRPGDRVTAIFDNGLGDVSCRLADGDGITAQSKL